MNSVRGASKKKKDAIAAIVSLFFFFFLIKIFIFKKLRDPLAPNRVGPTLLVFVSFMTDESISNFNTFSCEFRYWRKKKFLIWGGLSSMFSGTGPIGTVTHVHF